MQARDAHVDPAALVDDAVARYALSGIPIDVVVDGDVVLRHTHGDLRAGQGQAIDADTLFKTASNSRAMTATVLARQFDADLLRWEYPVVCHLPDFRMAQNQVTRDLLIHDSGLGTGAGDQMRWPSANRFTCEEVIHGRRHLQRHWSFRTRYACGNTPCVVVCEVTAAVAGLPFDALVRR